MINFIYGYGEAKPKISFPFFVGSPTPPAEENKKGKENFGFCTRESASVVEAHWFASPRNRSIRCSFKPPQRSARAKSVRVLLEMSSNFFKQTPPYLICFRIDRAAPEARAWAGISAKKFQGVLNSAKAFPPKGGGSTS